MTLINNKALFERSHRTEKDAKVKERMLLVLNVVYHGKVAAQVAREIHRSRSWACQWLKGYDKQGMDGLKDIPKNGRRTELPVEIEYKIKTILKESNQGWTTKQIEQLIVQNTGVRYHLNHIYRIVKKWGFKQKVPRKVPVNTASKEKKDEFKKRQNRYLVWVPNTKKKTLP
ncbi:MAG: winged helix-turn-helix domain-containing protein [Candidatus Nitrosocosmicus sp.]|nr:winged helix-turn-helix domain-containing protein [Candidatus Nitrosocosmicus sp.]MDN5867837.1 winged helix-turn-helix domain-containing protein [Candidatus Nitrosocosmicus sp.]